MTRTGWYRMRVEMWRKKEENGRAPSRENAQACRDAATI